MGLSGAALTPQVFYLYLLLGLQLEVVQLQGLLCLTPLALGHGAGNTTS